jgi:hypothetical protein
VTEPRRIAVVRSYDDLVVALRGRVDELKVAQIGLDEELHLARGHVNKLIGPVPVKSLGRETLGPIIQALGLVMILEEDPIALQIAARMARRKRKQSNADDGMLTLKRRKPRGYWRKDKAWGRTLAARRFLILSPARRRMIARRAAKARWKKQKAGEKLAANTEAT